jgi:hypothetical protein
MRTSKSGLYVDRKGKNKKVPGEASSHLKDFEHVLVHSILCRLEIPYIFCKDNQKIKLFCSTWASK